MKQILSAVLILFSLQAFALQTVICTPAKNPEIQIEVKFHRDVNPKTPFTGFLQFGAVLQVRNTTTVKSYTDSKVIMTPEVYTTDINLRGDSESSHIRLYPQFDEANEFTHYTGQLFINDLETKTYFNFRDQGATPGLVCK